jgi:hypothetical protein
MHGGYENEPEETGCSWCEQSTKRWPSPLVPHRIGSDGLLSDGDTAKAGLVEKPKLAIVPFRHSKITELFQDFFIGEGRAVSHIEYA